MAWLNNLIVQSPVWLWALGFIAIFTWLLAERRQLTLAFCLQPSAFR